MINDIKNTAADDESSDEIKIDFKPPEEISQEEENNSLDSEEKHDIKTQEEKSVKKSKKKKFSFNKKLTKKQAIILGIIGAILVISLIFWWFVVRKPSSTTTQPATVVAPPKPTTESSKLSGLKVPIDVNKRSVTGVMIENSPDSRPQSGLTEADIVFEAVAEAGITRFLALFHDNQSEYIGPIRSVRPYYLDWLLGFDASIAHVGGSPDALAAIKTLGVKDLDQFHNSGAYSRIGSRYAPHNVYSSIPRLNQVEASKGYGTSVFTSLLRKTESASAQPTAKIINLNISGFLYNPRFDYDAATNSYKRTQAGQPHINEKNGVQISPKVVIALAMSKGLMADGLHTAYGTIGSGKAYIFQDGTVTEATWKKSNQKEQITFTDANSNPIKLNPGQTWISIVGAPTDVTYAAQ